MSSDGFFAPDLRRPLMPVFEPSQYQFTCHAFAVLTVGVGIFFFGFFFLVRERGSSVSVRNWIFTLTESLWLLSFGMAYASRRDDLVQWWFLVGDIGVVFIPAALLALNVTIAGRGRELRGCVRASVALSLLFCTALITSDHFIGGLHHYSWGPAPAYGVIGILFIAYVIAVGVGSLILFIHAYRNSTEPHIRLRQRGFLVAALIGYPAFVDFIPKFGIPLYPFGYMPVALYMIYVTRVIVLYRMVDITPELATKQILETMQGAVIVADLEGSIRVVNRAAQVMLGRGRGDLLGRDLAGLLPVNAGLRDRVRRGERAASQEMVWMGQEGQRHEVNVSASLLTDGRDDTPIGVVYVAHDITNRKLAEEGLKEANRKLENLDKLKSDFVSIVSHELRTPLTSIKANAELILMKPAMELERKHKFLKVINEESERLGRLINDLLDLSRIEAGMVHWRDEELSLEDVLQKSVDGVLPLVQVKGLRLKMSIDESLPPVHGDVDRLVQLMTNLLSNAVKFTPAGGTITVEGRLEPSPQRQLVVAVSDTGSGIPPGELKLIFDKFHRSSDQFMSQTEGTGLGLSIARQIVEHHGGAIWATSAHGSGSTFTFTLPLAPVRPMLRGAGPLQDYATTPWS